MRMAPAIGRLAGLCTAAALVAQVTAVTGQENANVAAEVRPGFLEMARDPDASAEQKRTVSAMMQFVQETDPVAAFEKLKAADHLILSRGHRGRVTNGLSDLTPLSEFTNLETLVLWDHRISDLSPIASLQNLRFLRLEVNRISDISPLANLRRLESLQIDYNLVSDLRPLSGLSRLWYLSLSNNQVSDVGPLAGLKELRTLNLGGNRVTDLKTLAEMPWLMTLRLNANGIADLSDLGDMKRWSSAGFICLDLSDNAICDVGPISQLRREFDVILANNRIVDAGVESLLRNPALRAVDLRGNRLSRVPDLRNLKRPLAIDLRGNPIEDYANLVGFKEENPRAEIRADEEFTRAFEKRIPVKEELEESPLLGVWRTGPLVTEWGPLVLEMRFEANGVFYQALLEANPELGAEEEQGHTIDGRFAVRGDRLEITFWGITSEVRFALDNDSLTIWEDDGERIRYRKVSEGTEADQRRSSRADH